MTKDSFTKSFNVSRETLNDFCVYQELLLKWNKRINLVSNKNLENIWKRHFIDSAQIINHINAYGKKIVDVGSGAGFPGVVIGLLLRDRNIDSELVLVEKSNKKVFFLNEVIRSLRLNIKIVKDNINDIEPLKADILTARAFSELGELLRIGHYHCHERGVCCFLKGENYQCELDKTLNYWFFDYDVLDSLSSNSGKIIRVKNIFKR